MKMMVISLIILIVLIFVWGWFHYTYVDTITSYYWESMDDLSDAIEGGDWDRAQSDMDIYFDKWDKTKEIWIYFINQSNIDDIDISIRRLNVYINNSSKIMAQAESEELKILFNIIKENECLTWENIF